MQQEEMRRMIPSELQDKCYELFGNLEEIYKFHADIFLQDLENCISTTELVALCFTHRVLYYILNETKKDISVSYLNYLLSLQTIL